MKLDKRLKEIKERCEAATVGPWSVCDRHNVIHARGGCLGQGIINQLSPYSRDGDDEFISHARTDVPMLLEMVEKLLLALHIGSHEDDARPEIEKIEEKYNAADS